MFINETIFIYIHVAFPVIKHCLLLKERIRISWVIIQVNLKLSKQKKINLQCASFKKKTKCLSHFIYLFIFGWAWSSLLCTDFL